MRLWIKDPIAILADGAERGVVVEDGRIVELVGKGQAISHKADHDLRRLASRGASPASSTPITISSRR